MLVNELLQRMNPYQQTSGWAAPAINVDLQKMMKSSRPGACPAPSGGIRRLAAYDPTLDDEIVRAAVGAHEICRATESQGDHHGRRGRYLGEARCHPEDRSGRQRRHRRCRAGAHPAGPRHPWRDWSARATKRSTRSSPASASICRPRSLGRTGGSPPRAWITPCGCESPLQEKQAT